MVTVLAGCSGADKEDQDGNVTILLKAPVLSDATKAAYLKAINDARGSEQDCGSEGKMPAVGALTWSDALYEAAFEHSQDMAISENFRHDGSGTQSDITGMHDGESNSTIAQRLAYHDYNWTEAGENISVGTTRDTAQKAVDSWLESDPHCKNLMDAKYSEVGLADYELEDSKYTHYWTQVLAHP